MVYTIVIPVYNKEATILRAVHSALQQTLKPQEILIIDDCSTDDSMLQLEPLLHSGPLRVLQMAENSGISKVLNAALCQIKTPYFIQLDGDDWLEQTACERLIGAMESCPEAAFSYGDHRLWECHGKGQLSFHKEWRQPLFHSKYDMLLKLGYMLNPRCYRTECVKAVGGWLVDDPWEGRYYEDARMVIRLASRYKWIHLPELLHNVTISQKKSQSKIPMYNELRKSFYEAMLMEWGGEYKPVWETASTGRIILKELRPNAR